jgi:hypothetical protein
VVVERGGTAHAEDLAREVVDDLAVARGKVGEDSEAALIALGQRHRVAVRRPFDTSLSSSLGVLPAQG